MSPISWAIRPIRRYGEFDDRAPRREFWWFLVFLVTAHIVAALVEYTLGLPKLFFTYGPLRILLGLATLIPTLAVSVRRLHDTGRSGWWVAGLYAVNAVTNGIVIAASRPSGLNSTMLVSGIVQIGVIGVFLVLCGLPGTRGPNEYGPDPYSLDMEEVFA